MNKEYCNHEILLLVTNPSLKVKLSKEPSEIEFANLSLTDELYEMISEEINVYAAQYIASKPVDSIHSHSTTVKTIKNTAKIMSSFQLYSRWHNCYINLTFLGIKAQIFSFLQCKAQIFCFL